MLLHYENLAPDINRFRALKKVTELNEEVTGLSQKVPDKSCRVTESYHELTGFRCEVTGL